MVNNSACPKPSPSLAPLKHHPQELHLPSMSTITMDEGELPTLYECHIHMVVLLGTYRGREICDHDQLWTHANMLSEFNLCNSSQNSLTTNISSSWYVLVTSLPCFGHTCVVLLNKAFINGALYNGTTISHLRMHCN